MPEEPLHFSPNAVNEPNPKLSLFRILFKWVLISGTFVAILLSLVYWQLLSLNQAPDAFPVDTPITIEQGTEVKEITQILAAADIVQSAQLLYYALVIFHDPTDIKASTYLFESPLTTKEVAHRLTEGDFDTDLVRFTHFEGERATQIAANAAATLPNFDPEQFIAAAEPQEGKLWPETYFVPVDYDDVQLLQLLLDTFTEKTAPLTEQIEQHPLSLDEVLILASIIEREANTPESMSLVSSVLQNRLEIGMALQADASIEYVLDKPLSELTPADLEIDSLYNTYLYPGLPPTPIGNPGLDAIMAVLEPADSEYFYYITDDSGEFHFAKSYREHLQNIAIYLR